MFGGADDDTGLLINSDSAAKLAIAYACVKLLSFQVAMLPLILYRRLPNGGKERDPSHPLYPVLHDRPNRRQTSIQWRQLCQWHVLMRGNAYSRIIHSGGNPVEELWPLDPDRMRPFLAPDGKRAYAYQTDTGGQKIYLQDEILHIMGPSLDGIVGLNPIEYHRLTVGLGVAFQKKRGRHYKNNAMPGLILETPGKLSTTALQNLKESWAGRHQGVENTGRTGVLEQGVIAKVLSFSPADSQDLESNKLTLLDVCRIFGMQPHKVQILDDATYSNIEEQGLEFVTDSLMPWLITWEQSINMSLLSDASRRTHYVEHLVDALLRGNQKARFESYAIGRQWGWLSTNDILHRENMNPVAWGDDDHMVPMNMMLAAGMKPIGGTDKNMREVLQRMGLRLPEPSDGLVPELSNNDNEENNHAT